MGLWREEEAGSLTNRSLLIKTLTIIQTLNHYLLCSSASSTRDVPSLDDTSRECWLMQDRNFRISLVLSVFPAPLSPLRGENTRVVRRLIFWETLQQGTEMILIWNDYSSSSASVAVCFRTQISAVTTGTSRRNSCLRKSCLEERKCLKTCVNCLSPTRRSDSGETGSACRLNSELTGSHTQLMTSWER